MTASIQPDLFGEYDHAQEQATLWREPATCPSCGTNEPSGYLLNQNHGYAPAAPGIGGFPFGGHPIYGAMCVAQNLACSHISYAVRQNLADLLAERIERARTLAIDVEAVVQQAEEIQPRMPDLLDSIDQLD